MTTRSQQILETLQSVKNVNEASNKLTSEDKILLQEIEDKGDKGLNMDIRIKPEKTTIRVEEAGGNMAFDDESLVRAFKNDWIENLSDPDFNIEINNFIKIFVGFKVQLSNKGEEVLQNS